MVVAVSQHLVHFPKYALRMLDLGRFHEDSALSVIYYLAIELNLLHWNRSQEPRAHIAFSNRICLSGLAAWPSDCVLRTPSCAMAQDLLGMREVARDVGGHLTTHFLHKNHCGIALGCIN